MSTVIEVDGLSKQYSLGQIGSKRLVDDISRWWAKWRGKEDPLSQVGFSHPSQSAPAHQTSDKMWALQDVSFAVKQGEVLGLIGCNGAGKSTLLKILSRVTAPTAGEVRIKGRIASLLEVGTGFHQELTGRENIFLNGAILGMTKAEICKKLDEIVAFSEVEQFIDTPVKRYSSGMSVRLAFAVAAHLEPEILVVDEVLAVGDAAFQRKCLGKMAEVARQGRTILFVSHNMGAIETLTQRGLVLNGGKITFQGPTREAIERYVELNARFAEVEIASLPRSGNGRLQIRRVFVADAKGHPTNVAASGRALTIRIEYECGDDQPCKNVCFGLSLHDAMGQTLMIHYSDYEGESFDQLPVRGEVAFQIKELPLRTGRYYIHARVLVKGVEADWPRGPVGHFDVELGDFYGTGRSLHSGIATFLVRGEWSAVEPCVNSMKAFNT